LRKEDRVEGGAAGRRNVQLLGVEGSVNKNEQQFTLAAHIKEEEHTDSSMKARIDELLSKV
jgi:hypothetical protein